MNVAILFNVNLVFVLPSHISLNYLTLKENVEIRISLTSAVSLWWIVLRQSQPNSSIVQKAFSSSCGYRGGEGLWLNSLTYLQQKFTNKSEDFESLIDNAIEQTLLMNS